MLQPLTEALVLDENNVRVKNSSVEIWQRAGTHLQNMLKKGFAVSYQDDALIYNDKSDQRGFKEKSMHYTW